LCTAQPPPRFEYLLVKQSVIISCRCCLSVRVSGRFGATNEKQMKPPRHPSVLQADGGLGRPAQVSF